MQLTIEQEQQELENSDHLASIGNVDVQVARRVLRKYKGDMAKAADAILSGDRAAEAESWDAQRRNTPEPTYMDNAKQDNRPALPTSSSVIDLTVDTDDDMTRAIQMSMETSQVLPQFGPTERPPHPEWQMDPVAASTSHEEQSLNDAIQASLQDFKEDIDLSPLQEAIREEGRPIALRPDVSSLAYAALVLQALYYIPQVRLTCSNLRLPVTEAHTPMRDPNNDQVLGNLIELFTNMDLAQLATIIDSNAIPSLGFANLTGTVSLGDASTEAVKVVGGLIEDYMEETEERLFSFQHATVKLRQGVQVDFHASPEHGSVVTVEHGGGTPHNELIACISDNLSRFSDKASSHDVIINPSTVITFLLKRSMAPPISPKTSSDPFVYPKTIFLDRFLYTNVGITNTKRLLETKIQAEIRELNAYRNMLTRLEDGSDALKNLNSTIYYYEEVADPEDDPVRRRNLQQTAEHLKDIMIMILGKLEDIDHKIKYLEEEASHLYDCEELQNCQYDLRAVLLHTGLPGRKQMYSYVQDTEGKWWKTVDHEVTEVPEETVLTDPTGIHLGAGPYMLFYSRHMSEEQLREPLVWPTVFSEAVEENNKRFLAMMHPELEIFSSMRSSPDPIYTQPPPVTRELPIPGERKATGILRQESRSVFMDDVPPHL